MSETGLVSQCIDHRQGNQAAAASPGTGEVVEGLCVRGIKTCLSKGIKRLPKWIAEGKRRPSLFLFFPFHIKKIQGENTPMSNPFLFLVANLSLLL